MISGLSAVLMLTGGFLADAEPATPTSRAADTAYQDGTTADGPRTRREQPRDTVAASPQESLSHWQAGEVWQDGRWQSYAESGRPAADVPLLHEYGRLRNEAAPQVDAQLRLADWCRRHGLTDRERVHLTQALWLSDGRELPGLRERLGYRRVAGRWLAESERAAIEHRAREATESLRRWGTKLEGIARRLQGTPRSHESAVAELDALDDPAAVPAVEAVLTDAGEEPARQAVRYFVRVGRYQSSLALARQAVFSAWPSVRREATQALRSRKLDEFAPALLTTMRGTVEPRYQFLIGHGGQLLYSYQWAREMADHWQVGRSAVSVLGTGHAVPQRPSLPFSTQDRIQASVRYNVARGIDEQRIRNDLLRLVQDDLFERNQRAAQENRQAERLNARVAHVLADVSGQEESTDPRAWWDWWVDELDVQPPGKRVVIVEEDERVVMPQVLGIQPLRPSLPISCFAAGTPVWTDAGFVPIERIRVGDRVLAQDVESGELTYKPVLATTIRQAPHHLRLTVADETIQLTSGHHLWVPGAGWTRAKELRPGMLLHTVKGRTRVKSIEPVGAAPAFNLVVADAHTYFCGTSMILGHDVTIPQLTNVKEPGITP